MTDEMMGMKYPRFCEGDPLLIQRMIENCIFGVIQSSKCHNLTSFLSYDVVNQRIDFKCSSLKEEEVDYQHEFSIKIEPSRRNHFELYLTKKIALRLGGDLLVWTGRTTKKKKIGRPSEEGPGGPPGDPPGLSLSLPLPIANFDESPFLAEGIPENLSLFNELSEEEEEEEEEIEGQEEDLGISSLGGFYCFITQIKSKNGTKSETTSIENITS